MNDVFRADPELAFEREPVVEGPDDMVRKTQQRDAIRRALITAGRPLSPQEIVTAASAEAPGVGMATVYRTLKLFADEGWLATVALPGESPRYELAGKRHHHHFRCRNCDGVFELQSCALALEGLLPAGFQLEEHEVVLYGRCDGCAAKKKTRRSPRS
jgi:Fur family ferric uptake transcriptional regulator